MQDASLDQKSSATPAIDKSDAAERTTPKDPFKEALENQAQPIGNNQDMNRSVLGTHSKDPFKDFLEKQDNDLSKSKLSPFDSVSTK